VIGNKLNKRPDGKRLLLTGKVSFIVGLIAILSSAFRPFFPGILDYHPIAELLTMIGVLGTFLGAMAWMVGYVVFALSFIRGTQD